MYYQFDSFTGKLTNASNVLTPYYPLSPRPYLKAETSDFVFDQKSTRAAQVPGTSRVVPRKVIPNSGGVFYGQLDETFRKNTEFFQKADGLPIHLKRGLPDKILFGVTLAMAAVGIVSVFKLVYTMAVPKKQ